MKEILINYPIKFLQLELINIRTSYRLEKKKLIEILREMKSINKLSKEDLIDLLIKYNYDISKLPKLEDLIKPKKEPKPKAKKEELERLKAKKKELEILKAIEAKQAEKDAKDKEELEAKEKNPDLNKIIEIPEKSKKTTTDEFIKIRDDIKSDIDKYLPMYLPLFNINDLLSLIGFTRQDIKRLNIFLTPSKNAEELIDYSYIHESLLNINDKSIIYDILEPTAGTGNLIAELIKEKPEAYRIDAIEYNKELYHIGKARFKNFNNINWYNESFLDFKTDKKYDYIFMNPPFNINVKGKKYLDIDFVNQAYKLLKENGKLCAILSNTYTYHKNPKYIKFKEFIENNVFDNNIEGGFK
jgi:predicted RNA methylase